ncbi:hypothetical protein [Vibrio sp. Sgm 5]|uniref:hypothetical protein n=1 Tax=Vibrio sp. Sgm 5 TaxID=2994387 RepID=UPI0022488D1B|nr:hypothetical protein [Vibrio sp. Sgm 5]MCX2791356.1 hypothetical protein [Vibrio sp. Sgm 5]
MLLIDSFKLFLNAALFSTGCIGKLRDEFYFDDLGIELPEKQRYFETLNYVIDMAQQPP